MGIINGELHIKSDFETILCDGEKHHVNDIVDCIRKIKELDIFCDKFDFSGLIDRVNKLLPLYSARYWSKVINDRWYFTVDSEEDSFFNDYKFMSLYEGLAESYSKNV